MRAEIHKRIVFPPGFNEPFSLMTMIKWINASKLHEIKEVLKLDLQNLVLRYLILISMKIQRSRPTPTTSKSTSRQSHLHPQTQQPSPPGLGTGYSDLAAERHCFSDAKKVTRT